MAAIGLACLPGALEVGYALATAVYVAGVIWFARGVARSVPSLRQHTRHELDTLPFISIIIAARNEMANITACLQQVAAQDYPPNSFEVIVVDDGSEDATPSLVEEFASAHERDLKVQLLSTVKTGEVGSKKAALTLGIEAAQGDVIATTDADCVVGTGWLRGLASSYSPRVGMVVGFSQIGSTNRIEGLRCGWEALDFFNLMLGALGSVANGRPIAASGQNLSFRREAFTDVGGYRSVRHRVSGDDVLLLQLIRRTGHWDVEFACSAESHVNHPSTSTWRSLLTQRARWASNAPYQVKLDPLFFIYLSATFAMNVLFVLAPLLTAVGVISAVWPLSCLVAKVCSELALFHRGVRVFDRGDLWRYFPFWTLTQPFYIVVVGVLGCLGRFTWKGKRYTWGRRDLALRVP